MSQLNENFQRDLAEVCWRDLRIHTQRDAIVLVSQELDLIPVAVAVAEDRLDQVEAWVAQGQLGKPTAEQLGCWENDLDKPFRVLIVQPFILVQDIVHA